MLFVSDYLRFGYRDGHLCVCEELWGQLLLSVGRRILMFGCEKNLILLILFPTRRMLRVFLGEGGAIPKF
jgi:hypothetical protein